MNADREAAPVILNFARAVLVQRHEDIGAIARQRLVHSVIHNLVYAVMQAAIIRGANIHAGTLADGL